MSNPDRIVFPDEGITKGEVVAYYESVAERMLPFMEGRDLTVERFPKGMGEKGFMQKNAPEHFSEELIDRHEVPKEDGGTTAYPVIRGTEAVAAFANLGVITFHVPPSTADDPMHPDWVIWDLDPPSGEFDMVRSAATQMRDVLESFGISTALMTSGSNGYHLRARLKPVLEAATLSDLARGTAALAEAAHPTDLTLAFRKAERGDRVFVDWLRNSPHSTSVVPWSLRARAGAPVAVPLTWDELDDIDPNGVGLDEIDDWLDKDPWSGLEVQDLTEASTAVEDALAGAGIELEPFDRFRP